MSPPRPLAPPRGHTLGQRYHTLKGFDVGKCHTKFQLSSTGIEVISCKRNADVNLHLNLQVNLNLVTNVTYARTDVTSRRNAVCPTPAKAGGGIKMVREKSRECHNHKPQPFPDTKRKRNPTKPNKRKSNKRTKST